MTTRSDPEGEAAAAYDPLYDDDSLTHQERIERLLDAVIREPAERLRFEDELARGGMGSVRAAFDATLQRRMVVKTLHAESFDHVLLVHGFLREAQVTGQLDHPNIVPIHELGRDEHGEPYFTMKHVDGESLRARVGRAPAASYDAFKERLEIFVKLCDPLAFAHSRGVIHCDIKAANVMVGEYGQVYLMDWGGAQLLPRPPGVDTRHWVRDSVPRPKVAPGVVFGTPAYMSPEQAAGGGRVDRRSDIFSMGALLYELMTGKPPYTGGTPREGVARALSYDFAPIEERPHLYPRELIRIAMTAMARDPDDRYQTVEALQEAVAGLLSGGGNFPTMRVRAGTPVISEGDVGDAAYWIESGTFEVYRTQGGARRTMRVLGPGVFFGETAIFARTRRTASVVARTDGVLKVFTATALQGQLDAMTPWMRSLIQTLARWFAGPDAPQAAAATAATADEPSVTEFVGAPAEVSRTIEAESVMIDIVDGDDPTDGETLDSGLVEVDDAGDAPGEDAATRMIAPTK